MTLIQLISEQTMQNVLAILALQPSTVVSVLSQETPRFRQAVSNIMSAVQLAAQRHLIAAEPAFAKSVAIGPESPRIEQAQRAVADIYKEHPAAVLNYTGGTKDMSIGAWLAAREAGAGAIYCDTPREFRSEGAREVHFPVTLPELARKLSVEIIVAAQGFQKGRDWSAPGQARHLERFGEVAFDLQCRKPEAMRQLRSTIRQHGLGGKSRKPNAEDLQRASHRPLPIPDPEAVVAFLSAAVECKLLRQDGHKWFLNVRQDGSHKERSRRLEDVVMHLDGGAFEGYTQACLGRSGRFVQFLRGIRPATSTETADFGQTDFLAFDPRELSLALITCKSTPPSLEHLESVLARKEKLGGRFARGILCVQSAGARQETALREQLRRLGMELAVGQEVEKVFRCGSSAADARLLTQTPPAATASQTGQLTDAEATRAAVEALFRDVNIR